MLVLLEPSKTSPWQQTELLADDLLHGQLLAATDLDPGDAYINE